MSDAVDDPPSQRLDRVTAILRETVALLETIVRRLDAPTREKLLTKQEVARQLGVSTRWVERHIVPIAQPTRRGRAWYSAEDVEHQLASWRHDAEARTGRSPAPRKPRAAAPTRDRRAKEIEAELRRDLERRR